MLCKYPVPGTDSKGWRRLVKKKKNDDKDIVEATFEEVETSAEKVVIEQDSDPVEQALPDTFQEQTDDEQANEEPSGNDADEPAENQPEEVALHDDATDVSPVDPEEAEKLDGDPEDDAGTSHDDTAEALSEDIDALAANEADEPMGEDTDAAPVDEDSNPFDQEEPIQDSPESKPEPESAPEPEPAEPEPVMVQPTEQPPQKTAGVGTMLVGGIIAAVIGYLAASANLLPAPWQAEDPIVAALQSDVASQGETLQSLQMAEPVDLSAVQSRIDEISGQIGSFDGRFENLGTTLATLEDRIAEIEARPPVVTAEGEAPVVDVTAFETQLAALQDTVSSQRAEVEAMIAEAREMEAQAADTARVAAVRAALARLQAALEDGSPFQAVIDELAANGAEIPEGLASAAGDGVTTLSSLRAAYPDVARNALSSARSGEDTTGSIGAFLQRQLGARSVEPRDGDDADAILSRVEASLTSGDLATALQEAGTLPEAAQSALSDWIALARQRLTAQEAIAEIASGVAEN